MDSRFEKLLDQLQRGKIDRRTFIVRAVALGVTGSALASGLSRVGSASAQEGGAASIGNPDIPHIEGTDKGLIKVYSSWPRTGSMEGIGVDAFEAAKLAFADFGNMAGGFAIEYVPLDSGIAANNGGWDPGVESANANQAIADPDCMAYMGTYNSGAAKISIPIMNEAGMAMISFANTYSGLTKNVPGVEEGEPDVYYPSGKRNYARVIAADDIQGALGARWAVESKNVASAYVLDDQSLYGHGVAQVFNDTLLEIGAEVLGFEGYDPKAPDYQALMTKIADAGPDLVYVGATVENNPSKVLLDMRGLMPADQVIFLGPDGLFTQAFIDGAGDASEGAFLTFAGLPTNELEGPGADYFTRMSEILGHAPDGYSTYSYDCTVAIIQAIDQVGEKDRGKILDALMGTTNFTSLVGKTWSLTETGDIDTPSMSMNEIKPNDEGNLAITFLEVIGE
ncbi:MAG TPA: branched-chain amino acid ABC transporter substrate-binding protein [Thermomicrobiales bacterium]|nr:branched-chain amino acid ABC transporter substrate-binding protein [Thermomicrobiales bacterium]